MTRTLGIALLLSAPLLSSNAAFAQNPGNSAPVAAPIPPSVPDAVDTPYPGGTMRLDVDASDIARATLRTGWHPDKDYIFVDNFTLGAATPVSAVPEPATWAMMIAGFGLAGSALRRRRAGRDAAYA